MPNAMVLRSLAERPNGHVNTQESLTAEDEHDLQQDFDPPSADHASLRAMMPQRCTSHSGPSATYAISTVPNPHVHRHQSLLLEPTGETHDLKEDALAAALGSRYLNLDWLSMDARFDHDPVAIYLDSLASIEQLALDNLNLDGNLQQIFVELHSDLQVEAIQEPQVRFSAPSECSDDMLSVDWVSIYKGYWSNNCLSALHPVYHEITSLVTYQPILEDTIVALAACNLSRVSPQTLSTEFTGIAGYRPNSKHLAFSQRHYNSAVTKTRFMTETITQTIDSEIILSVLILLSCLNSSVGNFSEFYTQSREIVKTTQRIDTRSKSTSALIHLLAAWMQTTYHIWWARLYFSTFDFQLEQSTLSTPAFLEENAHISGTSRAIVMSILCESHRLHQKMLLGTFSSRPDAETIAPPNADPVSEWYRSDMYRDLLKLQAEKLDVWEQNLLFTELPTSMEGEMQYLLPEGLLVAPLQFSSHNAAMNYAYYISARLMQDAPIDLRGEHITDSDHWVFLLLRVAAGINHQTCLRDNAYTIGLSSLLLAALLHTCSLDVGLWIENWLHRFQLEGQSPALEEGSFPPEQIVTVVTVINQQRRLGRNVFAVSQAEDDGGGKGKMDSYHSQNIKAVWLHGRERATGALFQESVTFEP